MGLLQRSKELRQRDAGELYSPDGLIFEEFCAKYGFCYAGFLRMTAGVFAMRHSYMLTARTVCHSVSTRAFWEVSTPSVKKWCLYTGEAIKDFHQIFDQEIIGSIKALVVYRLCEGVFIAYSTSEDSIKEPQDMEEFYRDLLHLKELVAPSDIDTSLATGNEYTLGVISVLGGIENSLDDMEGANEDIKQSLIGAIFEEVYRIICKGLGGHNYTTFDKEKEIKVAICIPHEVNSKLFLMHLQNACKKVIGKFAVQFLSYLEAGMCKNEKALRSFIL